MEKGKHERHHEVPATPEEMTRRRFLSYLTGLLAGIIALIAGIPLAGFVISPLLQKKREIWVKLGPASALIPGEPVKFIYSYQRIDGWFEKTVHNTVYGVESAKAADEIVVLSNICTHLGCGVRWDDGRRAFLCPCHNGVFDMEGKVVSGPPPKPLPRLRWKIAKGQILVRVEEV